MNNKITSKLISITLSLAMIASVFSAFTLPAFADGEDEVTGLSSSDFASGKLTYLLNGSTSSGDLNWFQTIDTDDEPTLDSASSIVYYNSADDTYTNDNPLQLYAGGDGTEASPYLITTAAQLKTLSDEVAGGNAYEGTYFKLGNDIDLSSVCSASLGSWVPIGKFVQDPYGDELPFKGTFDGDNHTVSNLYIVSEAARTRLGLFGINEGTIKNLTVSGTITDGFVVGGIASTNTGTISNCHNQVVITNGMFVGGIVGQNNGTVEYCGNTATITASNLAGGITYLNSTNSIIKNCYNTGAITASRAAGLAASVIGGKLFNSFNSGVISGTNTAQLYFTDTYDVTHIGYLCYVNHTVVPTSVDGITTYDTQIADEGTVGMTEEQFASGEAAYYLNGNTSTGDLAWYQTIGTDNVPTLDSTSDIVRFDASSGTYYNGFLPPERKIYVDYMGRGETPADTSQGHAGLTDLDIGTEFWVGVSVDKSNDLELITDGVYSLELAFDYDPSYIVPYTDASTTWAEEIEVGNIKTGATLTDSAWWNEDYSVARALTDADIVTDTDREGLSIATTHKDNGWKMCFVNITFTGADATALRFKDMTSSDKQYLVKLPFKLVNAPALEAPDDEKPIVMYLGRGPNTLVIGSGTTGDDPFAAWEATVVGDDEDDAHNLKTLYSFDKEINLFTTASATLDGLKVTNAEADESGENEEYTLYHDIALNDTGFDSERYEYYVRVPHSTSQIVLTMTSDEQPAVKYNTTKTINVDSGTEDKQYLTSPDPVDLEALNPDIDTGSTDFFNHNVIKITVGESEYTIYVERLVEPKIELAYGNSPYGMIMKEPGWTDTIKAEALASFIGQPTDEFTTRYRFKDVTASDGVTSLVPSDADTSVFYCPYAWNTDENDGSVPDAEDNYDLNEYSVFVYQGHQYVEPGYTVYDAEGRDITATTTVLATTTVKEMVANDYTYMKTAKDTVISNADGSANTFDKIGDPYYYIRPGIYVIDYSFEDPVTNKAVTNTRPFIEIWENGDTDLSAAYSDIDASTITQMINAIIDPLNSITGQERCVYTFRIVDVDNSGSVSDLDKSFITQNINGLNTKVQFYKYLD